MPKQKSPSKHKAPKTYDFETPLDPFQGESLKGIAAFIQSSLTLQPHAQDVGNMQPHELHLPNGPHPDNQQIDKNISSIPNTTIRTSCTDVMSTLVTDISSPKAAGRGPSVPDTHILSIPNKSYLTGVTSVPITNKFHDVSSTELLADRSPAAKQIGTVSSTQGHDKSVIPDTTIPSIHNTSILSVPNTNTLNNVTSTPTLVDCAPILKETGAVTSTPDANSFKFVTSVLNTSSQSSPDVTSPVDENPGSNRVIQLKVRVAVRGQDGLNKGEQKIYTFLWRAVYRPKEVERGDFRVADRTIEISLRGIAKRVDLGLANCAWHVRGLEEKGCIVRVRESDHYRPAVYRIREFTEIIEWRRDHGLTHFIQRGHLAAFVDPKTGVPLTKFRGQTGTVYCGQLVIGTPNMGCSGISITVIPSTPNTPDTILKSNTPGVSDLRTDTVFNSNTASSNERKIDKETDQLTSSSFLGPPLDLIQGLQRLVAVFDNEAASSLWNECRTRAADCTVEEVLHFSNAKAATFRTGKIQNPTGFLLVTVPKCFEGEAFRGFREQQHKWREEQQRREEEELKKAQIIEDELHLEQESYRKAEEALASLSAEEYQDLYEQKRIEYLVLVPRARSWTQEALDQSIRAKIIRQLQSKFLRNNQSTS